MKQVLTYAEAEFITDYAKKLLAKEETTKEEDAQFIELRDRCLEEWKKEGKPHGL